MTAFLLAGLLGVFGPGPLSSATSESQSGTVQVQYQRMAHIQADDSLTLRFSEDAIENGKIRAEVTGNWVHGMDLSAITPQPSTQYAIPGGVAFDFDVLGTGDTEATLAFRAQEYWGLNGQVTVGDESVAFSQFVLP